MRPDKPMFLIPPQAEREHQQLGFAVKKHEKYVPCLQIDEVDWFSDEDAERAEAIDWCKGCPVLQLCSAYADKARERNGVWAAVDRTAPGLYRKRAKRPTEARRIEKQRERARKHEAPEDVA